ncbi:conserved hypothetical protein [Xenorhabdus bovienii str. oregonense]|uniref:Uncharacterized protein n=1 Tax=Xenorhabdus bovienii str. oregonense TaxID=1398202 RepID=A0A077P6J1_XENBV|nr:hypothetical protein [Xenorhabdus bovienii]CDH05421.1 conserved hypothetical protein [Xenorhabdus bovienii str. oregonense]
MSLSLSDCSFAAASLSAVNRQKVTPQVRKQPAKVVRTLKYQQEQQTPRGEVSNSSYELIIWMQKSYLLNSSNRDRRSMNVVYENNFVV